MKKLWIFSAVFLLAGVIMLLVPIHMQPTGAVLLLLGLGMGRCQNRHGPVAGP